MEAACVCVSACAPALQKRGTGREKIGMRAAHLSPAFRCAG